MDAVPSTAKGRSEPQHCHSKTPLIGESRRVLEV